MEFPGHYILPAASIANLSPYDLLRFTRNGASESGTLSAIYPLSLEIDAGTFTKQLDTVWFPDVTVRQAGNSIETTCTCGGNPTGLCEHQAEVIYAILQRKPFRTFFDAALRRNTLLKTAREFGLEEEPDLDGFFRITHKGQDIHIERIHKALIPVDERTLGEELLPQEHPPLQSIARPWKARPSSS